MKIGNGEIWLGDCLDLMKTIPDQSIDMVLCDLPYGTTACKWDSQIPFEPLWKEYWRIAKPNAAIILTAAQPFTSLLVVSQKDFFKYSLVWKKSRISHFAQAPYRFLTEHEDICLFSKAGTSKNALVRMKYRPQNLKDCHKIIKGKGHSDHRPSKTVQGNYMQIKTGYPKSILDFKSDGAEQHPTQKPVSLFEYLIKTYSDEGDLVLDNACGSGTTAIAAHRTNRKWLCIEKEPEYYFKSVGRIFDEVNK